MYKKQIRNYVDIYCTLFHEDHPLSVVIEGNTEIMKNQTLHLTCYTSAIPSDITYTWTYPGKGTPNENELHVDNIQKTDAGSYYCTAENTINACVEGPVTDGTTESATVKVMCELNNKIIVF